MSAIDPSGRELLHRTYLLLTQSGLRSAVSSAVTKGCPRAVLRLHLMVSIDKKMIEVLNANKAEPRIFHICERVKRDRQRRGKNEHVNPAARFGSGHAKSSKQRAA